MGNKELSKLRPLTAFVDESYQQNQWYFISACVMDDTAEMKLSASLKSILEDVADLGISPDAEFHGYDIFHGSGDWAPLSGQIRRAIKIYSDVVDAVAESGAIVFFSGVHSAKLVKRYGPLAFHPHEVVMHNILGSLDEFLERKDQRVKVVADKVQEQSLREKRMADFKAKGTMGYKSRTLERIFFPFEWAPSSRYRGLQASDVLLFMYQREFNIRAKGHIPPKEVSKLGMKVRRKMVGQRLWEP